MKVNIDLPNSLESKNLDIERDRLKELNRCHREWRTARKIDSKLDARVELVIALEKFTAAVLGNSVSAK